MTAVTNNNTNILVLKFHPIVDNFVFSMIGSCFTHARVIHASANGALYSMITSCVQRAIKPEGYANTLATRVFGLLASSSIVAMVTVGVSNPARLALSATTLFFTHVIGRQLCYAFDATINKIDNEPTAVQIGLV